MQRLALFDIDKTIYKKYTIFDIVDYLVSKDINSKTVQKQIYTLLDEYKQMKLNYQDATKKLIEVWADDLQHISTKEVREITLSYFMENLNNFYTYWSEIIPILKTNGYDIFIVTASSQFIAEAITSIFELKGFLSSTFEEKNGLFTGKISQDLSSGKALVSDLLSKYSSSKSIAVGDSENDILMLSQVEKPFCMKPDEKLKEYATINNWAIIDELTAFTKISKFITSK